MTALTVNSASGVLIRDAAIVVIRGDMTGRLNESKRFMENGVSLSLPPRIKHGVNFNGSPERLEKTGFLLPQE
jgi:hypothetical protein